MRPLVLVALLVPVAAGLGLALPLLAAGIAPLLGLGLAAFLILAGLALVIDARGRADWRRFHAANERYGLVNERIALEQGGVRVIEGYAERID